MKKLILSTFLILTVQITFGQSYRVNRTEESKKSSIKGTSFGKNIISFTPMQILLTDVDQSEPDVTIGLSYERIFNNELMSFRLPIAMSIVRNNYFYLMPTLKLYPKKQGIVKYAVGPQLLFAFGDDSYQKYINSGWGGYYQTVSETRKQFGFLINNNVNFTISKAFYLALDFSLGLKYYDSFPRDYNGLGLTPFENSNISPAFQLNFNFGARF